MNREYWEKRAKALEYYLQLDAVRTRNEIIRIYTAALDNIDREIHKIRRELQKLTGSITEEELNALLSKAQRDKSYEELLSLLEGAENAAEEAEIMRSIDAQAYGARITRADLIKNKILAEFTKAVAKERSLCRELFSSVFGESYYTNIFNLAEGYDTGIAFDILPGRAINAALSEPWSGENFSKRIWQHSTAFTKRVEETIVSGLMSGKSNAEMTRALKEFTEEAYYVKERLIRTETAHFYALGQLEAYREAGIERYRFVAGLSERTCGRCADIDSRVFYVEEATEGENYPPLHPNCRCTTITADAEIKTRAAKDPETGRAYKVDGSMSFAEWKESLTDEQKQAFEVNVRKYRNKSSDQKQYERYIDRLGTKNMPKTLDLFQDLKYNDIEKWEFMKLDYQRQGELLKRPEFALPNAQNATADDRKFTGYLFSPSNKRGYAKGKAFTSRLGYDIGNFGELKQEIISRATKYPVAFKQNNGFGDLYEQKIILYGSKGTPANVVIGWEVKGSGVRMTSAYIKEV